MTRRRAQKAAETGENHLVEWKESWRDEYLRWLCGFANAEGGTLVIGKNDNGEPVGAPGAQRLLVDLPEQDPRHARHSRARAVRHREGLHPR